MNPGRNWEQELNASLDQQRKVIDEMQATVGTLRAFDELMDYYDVVSPAYAAIIRQGITHERDKADHLRQFINNEISLYLPYGSVRTGSEHSLAIDNKYPIKYDNIWLFEPDGTKVLSKEKALISKSYIMRLEKNGENWAATSIPKRQHHGIISKLSAETKTELPWRSQAIRFGETEFRAFITACNPVFATALLSMANNSQMCRDALRTILTAKHPTAIREVVDYTQLDKYQSVAIDRIKHIMSCFGFEYYYDDERAHTYETKSLIDADIVDFNIEGDD